MSTSRAALLPDRPLQTHSWSPHSAVPAPSPLQGSPPALRGTHRHCRHKRYPNPGSEVPSAPYRSQANKSAEKSISYFSLCQLQAEVRVKLILKT